MDVLMTAESTVPSSQADWCHRGSGIMRPVRMLTRTRSPSSVYRQTMSVAALYDNKNNN